MRVLSLLFACVVGGMSLPLLLVLLFLLVLQLLLKESGFSQCCVLATAPHTAPVPQLCPELNAYRRSPLRLQAAAARLPDPSPLHPAGPLRAWRQPHGCFQTRSLQAHPPSFGHTAAARAPVFPRPCVSQDRFVHGADPTQARRWGGWAAVPLVAPARLLQHTQTGPARLCDHP